MKKCTRFVGLEDSKNSIDVAVASEGRDSEVRFYGTISNTPAAVKKLVRRLGRPKDLYFAYEAGPCGYGLYRELLALGANCMVAAPSKTPRASGDRIKTDRRDAITLARLHRAGELHPVWVPDEETEAMRDLTRAREDAKYVGLVPSLHAQGKPTGLVQSPRPATPTSDGCLWKRPGPTGIPHAAQPTCAENSRANPRWSRRCLGSVRCGCVADTVG
jgi:hypothetical protein